MKTLRTILLASCLLSPATLLAAPRDSVSISRDWRFTKGDPAGLTEDLRYDVRPRIEDAGDGKVADARPDAAAGSTRRAPTKRKGTQKASPSAR